MRLENVVVCYLEREPGAPPLTSAGLKLDAAGGVAKMFHILRSIMHAQCMLLGNEYLPVPVTRDSLTIRLRFAAKFIRYSPVR